MVKILGIILLINLGVIPLLQARNITITTFNIKLYGIGGEWAGTPEDEYRDPWLQEFLGQVGFNSDVILFQEIVDVNRLQNLMGTNYNCLSYFHPRPKHQKVALCHKTTFGFVKEVIDDNFIIEEVALGKYRPALWGVLTDNKKIPLMHIVGVHLKARPSSAAKRDKQMEIISKKIGELNDQLPIIVLGDFNSFDQTGDEQMIQEWLRPHSLIPMEIEGNNTYITWQYQNKFDHIFASESLTPIRPVQISGPCNNETLKGIRFNDVPFYNRFISDHCPLSISFIL